MCEWRLKSAFGRLGEETTSKMVALYGELRGHQVTAVRPREQYQPLFAYSVLRGEKFMGLVGVSGVEQTPPIIILASGVRVLGIDLWMQRLANAA